VRSGERYERWAMPLPAAHTHSVRRCGSRSRRQSTLTFLSGTSSENSTSCGLASAHALIRDPRESFRILRSAGCPPSTGTTRYPDSLRQPPRPSRKCAFHRAKTWAHLAQFVVRELHRLPSGSSLRRSDPARTPSCFAPLMKPACDRQARSRLTAESAKFVICANCCSEGAGCDDRNRTTRPAPQASDSAATPACNTVCVEDSPARFGPTLPRSDAPRGGDRRPGRASTGSDPLDPSRAPSRPHSQRKRQLLRQRIGAVCDRVDDVEIGRAGKRTPPRQGFIQHHANEKMSLRASSAWPALFRRL